MPRASITVDGPKLEYLRKMAGLATQADAAKAAGVSVRTWSGGASSGRVAVVSLRRMADALGVDIGELVLEPPAEGVREAEPAYPTGSGRADRIRSLELLVGDLERRLREIELIAEAERRAGVPPLRDSCDD